MRIVGLLNWFEEDPAWLAGLVASLNGVCEHLVAVDGAYRLFPDAMQNPRSGTEQAAALTETAHQLDIGLTIDRPAHAWRGNEVEKRDHLVKLGLLASEPTDWFLQVDADELLLSAPADLHVRLEEAEEDVAGVTLTRRNTNGDFLPMREGFIGHRVLFRARRDLRVEYAHYMYLAGTRVLRGPGEEPALDMSDLKLEHRHDHRLEARNTAAHEYSLLRDEYEPEMAHA
jgi:hypothetical protein